MERRTLRMLFTMSFVSLSIGSLLMAFWIAYKHEELMQKYLPETLTRMSMSLLACSLVSICFAFAAKEDMSPRSAILAALSFIILFVVLTLI